MLSESRGRNCDVGENSINWVTVKLSEIRVTRV